MQGLQKREVRVQETLDSGEYVLVVDMKDQTLREKIRPELDSSFTAATVKLDDRIHSLRASEALLEPPEEQKSILEDKILP